MDRAAHDAMIRADAHAPEEVITLDSRRVPDRLRSGVASSPMEGGVCVGSGPVG